MAPVYQNSAQNTLVAKRSRLHWQMGEKWVQYYLVLVPWLSYSLSSQTSSLNSPTFSISVAISCTRSPEYNLLICLIHMVRFRWRIYGKHRSRIYVSDVVAASLVSKQISCVSDVEKQRTHRLFWWSQAFAHIHTKRRHEQSMWHVSWSMSPLREPWKHEYKYNKKYRLDKSYAETWTCLCRNPWSEKEARGNWSCAQKRKRRNAKSNWWQRTTDARTLCPAVQWAWQMGLRNADHPCPD